MLTSSFKQQTNHLYNQQCNDHLIQMEITQVYRSVNHDYQHFLLPNFPFMESTGIKKMHLVESLCSNISFSKKVFSFGILVLKLDFIQTFWIRSKAFFAVWMMMLTIFNSVIHNFSNFSTHNGAFFKDSAWLDFQAGLFSNILVESKTFVQTFRRKVFP